MAARRGARAGGDRAPSTRSKPAAGADGAEQGARPLPRRAGGHRQGGRAPTPTNALVLLVEFGTGAVARRRLHRPLSGRPARTARSRPPALDDNATFWPGDFSPMHYQQMLFGNSYPIYGAGRPRHRHRAATKVLPAGATRCPTPPRLRGHQRRHHAQLLPRAVARRVHRAGRHQATGSRSTCPSPTTAPTATRGTPPTTSPAPSGGSRVTPSSSSPPTTRASTGRSTTRRTRGASPARTSTSPTATSTT